MPCLDVTEAGAARPVALTAKPSSTKGTETAARPSAGGEVLLKVHSSLLALLPTNEENCCPGKDFSCLSGS